MPDNPDGAGVPSSVDDPGDSSETVSRPRPVQMTRLYFDLARGNRVKLWLAAGHLLAGILGHLVFMVATGTLVDHTLISLGLDVAVPGFRVPGGSINGVAVFLFGTMLVALYCTYVDQGWFIEVGERAAARLRARLFQRTLHLPMTFFDKRRSGELSGRILADVAVLQEAWVNDLRTFLKNGLLMIGSIAMLFLISAQLGFLVLLVVPPIVLASVWSGSRIRKDATSVQDRLSDSSVVVEESLTAIRSVKTFANESHEVSRFRQALDAFLKPAVKVGRHRAAYVCLVLFILLTGTITLMWWGSRAIASGEITPGQFTSFMFALAMSAISGGTVAELIGRFQRVAGATGRLLELLHESPEDTMTTEAARAPAATDRLSGKVVFETVSFSYPTRPDAPVLEDFSLTVDPGERVALVGPSGAGKTTVAALLFRLYEPTRGNLLLDDCPATEFPLVWLRNQMALVPQEVILFGGSIAENIAYGRPGASRQEIENAARQANALEFIRRLPEGFDTAVGDRGIQLSGGQRQRVAIARAVLKDPAILVLDEATSSLDTESESLVRAALEDLMKSRTSLVIAHRLSTVREADRIIVLRDGRIAEEGKHAELYENGGYYRLLCDSDMAPETIGKFDSDE